MNDVERRIRFLEKMLQERHMAKTENLYCYQHGRVFLYYVFRGEKKIYLTDDRMIREFAQKTYDRKLCETAEREMHYLQKGRLLYPGPHVEDVYGKLHIGLQSVIVPYWDLGDPYIQSWIHRPYNTMHKYSKTFLTRRGIQVRSKSEWLIDNTLLENGIAVHYEQEFVLPTGARWYPDFTILNPYTGEILYWEHFGRTDDPEYAEKMTRHLQEYLCAGFTSHRQMIFTFECSAHPLTQPQLDRIIKEYGLEKRDPSKRGI